MTICDIIERLEALGDPDAVAGMARFGIVAAHVYGVSIPQLRALAKEIGRDHELARQLWDISSRETRILSSMIDDPAAVGDMQLDAQVAALDSWEVCDQWIMDLVEKTPYAWNKAMEWSERSEAFVQRAGFVTMARLAVSDKRAPDERFLPFFERICRHADDQRTMVKKAVNWALRQIGKRNPSLNVQALSMAEDLAAGGNPVARWIGSDAKRELASEAVRKRLHKR